MGELDGVRKKMRHGAELALVKIGQDLEGKAQRDAPKKEGTLRGSSRSEIVVELDAVWVEVSFNTPYAARQHEELDYVHADGKAKYLESHVLEEAARYEGVLALSIGRTL